MKNVIIVGANGFLGSNLTKRLIEQNINVYAVVNQSIDRVDAINSPRLNIVRSLDELCNFEVDYYDALYYFAWMGNSGSERGDLLLQQENIMAVCSVMKKLKRLQCDKFIFAGSIIKKGNIFSNLLDSIYYIIYNKPYST